MLSTARRRTSIAVVFSLLFILPIKCVLADEGMFLPDAISQITQKRLAKLGLKIPITDIYNPNGVSIKDAVVIVDGGTGEFVSPNGLLLTNHHVAFEALVSASTTSKNLGETGYMASSQAEELQAKGYTVTLTQDMKDVTADVKAGINESAPRDVRMMAIRSKIQSMERAGARRDDGITVRIVPMNEGLSYYQFTYLILRDVRIVYSPPKAIGFFGGDPDNFEWPRHCGDFTFMRAYVGPDGKPADYAVNNVPFKPKKYLSLSMGGVREGDFTMVMGYPGSTRRYRESYSVGYNQNIVLPFYVDFFTNQIQILQNAGKNDPAAQIKLQSEIFGISNTLKDFEGSVLALRRSDLVAKKRAEEEAFTRWVAADATRKGKYGDALATLARGYQTLLTTAQRDLVLPQLFEASNLLGVAVTAQQLAVEKEKPGGGTNPALNEIAKRERDRAVAAFADRNPTVERELLTFLLKKADELPADQKIEVLEKRFSGLQGAERERAEREFASSVVDSKRFSTAEAVSGLYGMTSSQLRDIKEPFLDLAFQLAPLVQQIQERTQAFNATVAAERPLIMQGMSEMRGAIPYPDANRTLRFTYGEVKGYIPHDGAIYTPFTNLSGVVEKDTGREPYNVPDKLKQLYRSRDFGAYATGDGSNVPVDFLSTTDIIGGNSGSPIMNGRGEQIGIIFDGNFEGLGNDFFFNTAQDRAIAVDIRYVLFLTDKFGGAGYILKELDIKKTATARSSRAA